MTDASLKTLDDLLKEFRRVEREQEENRRRPLFPMRARTVALVLLLACACAGTAVALTGARTGVPVLDDLLTQPGPGDRIAPPAAEMPALPDRRLGEGGASEVLALKVGDSRGYAVAYMTEGGNICTAKALGGAGEENRSRGTTGNCYTPSALAEQLDSRPAVCCGIADENGTRIFDGFALPDVVAVEAVSGTGSIEARLTQAWTPRSSGAQALRYFVVTVPGTGELSRDGALLDLPRLRLTFDDGHSAEIAP